MGGACSMHGRDESAYSILVGKSEGKRPFGRSKRRWEDDIGTDIREIGWKVVDWMYLAQREAYNYFSCNFV
jgi:hypothetical protein